ncbi:MAG TPA: hypothetical protein DD723_07045 [Candidatus Omnitrophica bacterium]|nr:MAG: hypothetical protein A2Z81_05915 [Omnitrophica WOR_2 bacterium GWA2_45_18]HBR15281.1 hypothetical protein [Candidatus Omnitrophota bacterium]
MSKSVRLSVGILILLLMASLGFAGYIIFKKQSIEKEKAVLQQELEKSQKREENRILEVKKLQDQIKDIEGLNSTIKKKLEEAEAKSDEYLAQVNRITGEVDDYKRRAEELQREKDGLDEQVLQLEEHYKQKAEEAANSVQAAQNTVAAASFSEPQEMESASSASLNADENYWASVLREKVSLEVKLENLKEELSQKTLEIVNLKQTNTDIQLELDSLNHSKEDIDREIKYKEDLINKLSLEVARAKNEKKFANDTVEKINTENTELRNQLKQLATTKSALEKSIVRLAEEKKQMEHQLSGTETLIQSKIDEIWEIKDSLDKTVQSAQAATPSSNAVELPPIVVSSSGGEDAVELDQGMSAPGFNGNVISVNEENRFIIVDLGESSGIRTGDTLSVYRGSEYIASLEVIQVRKDISAADIKDQRAKIQAGDSVK